MKFNLRTFSALAVVAGAAAFAPATATTATAFPFWADFFEIMYPNSSTMANAVAAGGRCLVCHEDGANGGSPWNAYGWQLRQQAMMGSGVNGAFSAVEAANSDMDPGGFSNLFEIDNHAQPGWTEGANNTLFFGSGATQNNTNPPSGLVDVDPPAAPAFGEACNGDGGDQMGCSDCPCNNNAPQGTVGGCLNSAGTSARLNPSGTDSIAAADLRFEASGVAPNNSCVLTSGNALAPANAASPCFGLNSGVTAIQLDGLRCVVQGVLRHGVRPSDSNGDVGITTNGWGTPNGFFNFSAFVSGGTKHFQIIHRDDSSQVCMRGQNTSQAVSVTFTP